ncbi:uncharacterized protein LOC109605232 [Aethina tumida]|uniref:uncharacterized protein LOC109605232 n=1 Tax=Aethina tumida TaxID=116153 RepID=UPI002149015E|nr:uncharacterized protein LOC109605232 [Aethina tumida]
MEDKDVSQSSPSYSECVATQPITIQPVPGAYVIQYSSAPPRGINCLQYIQKIIIDKEVSMTEIFLNFKKEDCFAIKDELGRKLISFKEESSSLQRCCLGGFRDFVCKGFDLYGEEIINYERVLNWKSCCDAENIIEVFSPPGNSVGKVTYDKINRKFVIWDITGLEIFNIQCTFKCCGKNTYVILYGEEPISDINASKYIFEFSVPRDLQPIQKALIIGGVLLLKSMFYDQAR